MDSIHLMTEPAGPFTRIETDISGEIEAPIEQVWALFMDWPAIHRWMNSPPGPVDVVSSDLTEGEAPGSLPRTRAIRFAGAQDAAPFLETLLHADEESHTLYYKVVGVRTTGTRNYLCYTTMDRLENGNTRLRLNARFDIPSDLDVMGARDRIASIHEKGILEAFRVYLKANPAPDVSQA